MGTPAESLLTETIQSGKTFVGKAVVAREQVAQDRQLVLGYWLESKVDYHLLGMVLCKKHNRPHTNEENFRISLLRVELKWTPCIQNPCLRRFRSAANHIWVWAVSRTSSHLSCYLCRITWTYLHIALVSSLCTAYSILTPPLFPCWIRFSVFRLPRVNSFTCSPLEREVSGLNSYWRKHTQSTTRPPMTYALKLLEWHRTLNLVAANIGMPVPVIVAASIVERRHRVDDGSSSFEHQHTCEVRQTFEQHLNRSDEFKV